LVKILRGFSQEHLAYDANIPINQIFDLFTIANALNIEVIKLINFSF